MSCFVVSPKTAVLIANFITDHINMGFNFTHIYTEIPDEFKKLVCDKGGFADAEKVYKELYKLNVAAFNTRYEGRHQEDLEDCKEWAENYAKYNEAFVKSDLAIAESDTAWNCQLLSACQCFLYQCSESEELENSITYKTVKAIIGGIKDRIINKLPEYQAAEWD